MVSSGSAAIGAVGAGGATIVGTAVDGAGRRIVWGDSARGADLLLAVG